MTELKGTQMNSHNSETLLLQGRRNPLIAIIIWQLVSKVKESKLCYTLAAAVETTTPLLTTDFSALVETIAITNLSLKLHQTMQIYVYYDFNIITYLT